MRSQLRGKYLVRNRKLYLLLKIIDWFLSLFVKTKKKQLIETPKKILISNISHLGDVVISTSVLRVLKEKYPDCEIGFLLGSSTRPIIEKHPNIDYVHTFDHWKLNRSKMSFLSKLFRYFKTKKRAISEIKKIKYDVAIDLHAYFPNSIFLLSKARVPFLVGYNSAGFGKFLNMALHWSESDQYMSFFYFQLLAVFPKISLKNANFRSFLPPTDDQTLKIAKKLHFLDNFIVFHFGSGNRKKEWKKEKIREICKKMISDGHKIILTGKGNRENKLITQATKDLKNCFNFCDSLSVLEFIYVIKKAKLVVCVDSAIVHIASGFDVPTIVLYCGINNKHQWIPENVLALMENVDCSPCYLKNGCTSMKCFHEIKVQTLYHEIKEKLK